MKLTKKQLQNLILEELEAVLSEADDDNTIPRGIKREKSRYLPPEKKKPIPNPEARPSEEEEGKRKKDIVTNRPGKDGEKPEGGWVKGARERVAVKEDSKNEELQRIIQEEYETMVGPEIVTDPLTGQEYEDPYGGAAANLATFGEAYPGAYEEYAARGDEEYDPSTAPRLFRGEGEWSAHMTPEWQETVRANKAREDAEAAAIMQGILDADKAAMESTVPPNPLFEE